MFVQRASTSQIPLDVPVDGLVADRQCTLGLERVTLATARSIVVNRGRCPPSKTMSESNKVKKRFVRRSVAVILCASAMGQSQPEPSPSPSSMSPDKKWQYAGGDAPKIVQAGGDQVALEFSDGCSLGGFAENSAVLWAADSRRLAFTAVVREKSISLYSTNCVTKDGWH
jgi:hypothetical protein